MKKSLGPMELAMPMAPRRGGGWEALVTAVCFAALFCALVIAVIARFAGGGDAAAPIAPYSVCETCGRVLDGSITNCIPEGE